MKTELHNPGVSLRVPGATCEWLCRVISSMPDAIVTKRRIPFWSLSDGDAEFTFRGCTFRIVPDEFDGVYWVMSHDNQTHKAEMSEIQSAVESFTTPQVRGVAHPSSSTRSRKLRLVILILCIALSLASLPFLSPSVVFDETQTAWDVNHETHQNQEVAWGPRPRSWLLLVRKLSGEPDPSTFTGREWYFHYYETYCIEWLKGRKMVRPPRISTS